MCEGMFFFITEWFKPTPYIRLISYLSRGQGGEAAGVEELDQGACWDLVAHPEQQGEG